MALNHKILKYGMALIVLSLIFTIGFAFVFRLKEPVFLKMYVEQFVSSNENSDRVDHFELKYIANASDHREVREIYFEEEPDIKVYVSNWPKNSGGFSSFNNSNENNQRGELYGRYVLNTIYLQMDLNNIDKAVDEIEINNAKVIFDDGSEIATNLGRIFIYKDIYRSRDIDNRSSSSSNDGTSTSSQHVNTNIKLLEVKSPLLEDLKDYLDFTIEDIDYREISGMEFRKDQYFDTYSKLDTTDIINNYTFYYITPKVYYGDEKGNTRYIRIDNTDHRPYGYDLKGIFYYLRARGAI